MLVVFAFACIVLLGTAACVQVQEFAAAPAAGIDSNSADSKAADVETGETLAWHPSGEYFVRAGRLRGGNWNVGIFATECCQLIGQAKIGVRVTSARFNSDGSQIYLAGMQGQPGMKDDRFPDFGYFERYSVKAS